FDEVFGPGPTRFDRGRFVLEPVLQAARVTEGWADYELERNVETVDGTGLTLLVRAAIRPEDDAPPVVAGVVCDVTERRETEHALRELMQRYQFLVELSPDPIVVHQDGLICHANSAVSEALGVRQSQVVGKPITDFVDPDDIPRMLERIADLNEPGDASEPTEVSFLRPDGSRLMGVATSVRTTWDQRPAYQVVMHDITRTRVAEEEFAAMVAALDEGILVVDAQGRVRTVNRAAQRLLGVAARSETLAELLEKLPMVAADGSPLSVETHPSVVTLATGVAQRNVVIGLDDERGRLWFSTNSQPLVLPGDTQTSAAVCSFADITHEREAEAALSYQATHDVLTRLSNRSHLLDQLAVLLRRKGQPVAALFIDLDWFKHLNDSLGHFQADEVLQVVAGRLREAVPASARVGRLAGDEFVVLLPDIHGFDDAATYAQNLLGEVARPMSVSSGQRVNVTASVGVALSGPSTVDPEELVHRADLAMYRAKESGRNRVAAYDQTLSIAVTHRSRLRDGLRSAIEDHALGVDYQPIVDLITGETVGVEALARWWRPDLGQIPPATFVSIAEDEGLILALGEAVLNQAVEEFSDRSKSHPEWESLTLAVNVSPRQLVSESLTAAVANVLDKTGLDASRLWLEVTESALAGDSTVAGRVLSQLRSLGVRLALDDFGTGYSSLVSVRNYPIEMVKIDRSFVADLDRAPESAAIVSAVVRLAQSLNLVTVAEGVEHPAFRDRLRALGCDQAQGFLFGAPRPLDEIRLTR
ncbi:MAG: EAL domain-containing protein, partial [Acidimicrobiaceae bacterium]|nr:EAL domain-containing protein [Acidimicrobiaceae bacterium]